MKKKDRKLKNRAVEQNCDVVVIGGGLSGICAAISSARLGAKTVLVHDRSVLGGNSSPEICVPMGGANANGRYRFSRETGIINELVSENAYFPNFLNSPSIWSLILWAACKKEKNLTVFLNTSAGEPEVKNKKIISILAEQFTTEKKFKIYGEIFIDCSGDGKIAFESDASFMQGRESRKETGESLATKNADAHTMGNTIYIRAKNMGYPVPFLPPEWIHKFPKDDFFPGDAKNDCPHELKQLTDGNWGYWWIEFGGMFDTISDGEFIRDELIKYAIGVWDHIKNCGKHDAENYVLESITAMPGKRESRRFAGDYVLNQTDIENLSKFPDTAAYGGWYIDLHYPHGISGKEKEGRKYWHGALLKGRYSIPFRCLYSKNIKNLLFAGRNISVTHVALGTTRVMGTCAVMGQAAGTAAYMCRKYGCYPREIYLSHMHALQQKLLQQDCYLPYIKNENKKDLALKAKIKASSEKKLVFPEPELYKPVDKILSQSFVLSGNVLERIVLPLQNKGLKPITAKLSLRAGETVDDFRIDKDTAAAETVIPPGAFSAQFSFSRRNLESNSPYWIMLHPARNLYWGFSQTETVATQAGEMKEQIFTPKGSAPFINRIRGTHCITEMVPESRCFGPQQIISGVNRPEKTSNIWISEKGMPQWIELRWDERVNFNAVEITFDNNLDCSYREAAADRVAPELVKNYLVEVFKNGRYIKILTVKNNYKRKQYHYFSRITTNGLRLKILSTNGIDEARVFEIRVYDS